MLAHKKGNTEFYIDDEIFAKHFITPSEIDLLQEFAAQLLTPNLNIDIKTNSFEINNSWKRAYNALPEEKRPTAIKKCWLLLGYITIHFGKAEYFEQIGDFLCATIKNHIKDYDDVLKIFGLDALQRIACHHQEAANLIIEYYLNKLHLHDLCQLHMMLKTRTIIGGISFGGQIVSPQNPILTYILHLCVLHQNKINLTLKLIESKLPEQSDTKPSYSLTETNECEKDILISQIEAIAEQQDLTCEEFKPGKTNLAHAKLKTLSLDEIKKIYLIMTLPSPDGVEEEFTNQDQKFLTNLIQTFNGDTVYNALTKILLEQNQAAFINDTHKKLQDTIDTLDEETQRWLYVSMCIGFDAPTQQLGDLSEYITLIRPDDSSQAYTILSNTNLLRQNFKRIKQHLESNLDDKTQLLDKCILGIYLAQSMRMSNEHKLWLQLAIETQNTPTYFDNIPTGINGCESNGAIYQENAHDLITTYLRQGAIDANLNRFILNSLSYNQDATLIDDKRLDSFSSYIRHQIKETIDSLNTNSCHWLYLALAANIRFTQTQRIAQLKIENLSERQELIIQVILDKCYQNPDLINHYLENLIDKIEIDIKQSLDQFILHYTRTLWDNIDSNAKKILTHKSVSHSPIDDTRVNKLLYIYQHHDESLRYIEEKQSNEFSLSQAQQHAFLNYILIKSTPCTLIFHSIDNLAQCKMLFHYLYSNISETAQDWLKNAILHGKYNTNPLLAHIQESPSLEDFKNIIYMPMIIVMCIKHNSIKQEILNDPELDYSALPHISSLELDNLTLGNLGAIALCDSLYQQRKDITSLSLNHSQIEGQVLPTLNKRLLRVLSLENLELAGNKISSADFNRMLDYILENKLTNYLKVFFKMMLQMSNHLLSYGMIWSLARFEDEFSPMKDTTELYFSNESTKETFACAKIITKILRQYPILKFGLSPLLLIDGVHESSSLQACHAAIKSKHPDIMFNVLKNIIHDMEEYGNSNLIDFINHCFAIGTFYVPQKGSDEYIQLFADDEGKIDQNDIELLVAVACLAQSIPKGYQPSSYLNLDWQSGFECFALPNDSLPDILYSIVGMSIAASSHVQEFKIRDDTFDKNGFDLVCKGLAGSSCKSIIIENTVLTEQQCKELNKLITSNFNIQNVCIINSLKSPDATKQLLNDIHESGLTHLTITKHHNVLNAENMELLAKAIANKSCTIQFLDICHNHLNAMYINLFYKHLHDINPNSATQVYMLEDKLDTKTSKKISDHNVAATSNKLATLALQDITRSYLPSRNKEHIKSTKENDMPCTPPNTPEPSIMS